MSSAVASAGRGMAQLPHSLTLDDVATIAAADGTHRYELVKGVLLVMPPADAEHGNLTVRIGAWLISRYLGTLANPGVRVGAGDGRSPDLMVITGTAERGVVWAEPGGVALVLEIESTGSEMFDRRIKPIEYAEAGIPHFWRVERPKNDPPRVYLHHLLDGDYGTPKIVDLEVLLASAVPDLPRSTE